MKDTLSSPQVQSSQVAEPENLQPDNLTTADILNLSPSEPSESLPTGALREEMKRQARELGETAQALEQMAMFKDFPFEPAFYMPAEEIAKRYTAAQANKIEMRRRTCAYLLGRQCPIEDIMQLLEMNFRTVQAIAAQDAPLLASFSEKYARELMADAAADLAVARTKRDGASFKDLHIAAGIKMTHAEALKAMSGLSEQEAIEVETESPDLKMAREYLKRVNEKAHPTAAGGTGGAQRKESK